MQTKLFLISAACVWGASGCAHVQSAEMDPPAAQGPAPVEAKQAAVDTTGAQDSSASNSQVVTSALTPASQVPSPDQQPGDALTPGEAVSKDKDSPHSMAAADAKAVAPDADDHTNSKGEPVARFLLTRGIADREPVDEDVSFRPGERVYAFLEVANPDGGEYSLTLRWVREEGDLGEPAALTIGASPRWRTWSWLRAPEQAGSYRCFVETEDGQQMAEIPFRVES